MILFRYLDYNYILLTISHHVRKEKNMSIEIISNGNEKNKTSIRPYIKHVGKAGLVIAFTMMFSPIAFADEGKNATEAVLQAEKWRNRVNRVKALASTGSLVCLKASEKNQNNAGGRVNSLLLLLCGAFLGWMIKPAGEL